MSLVALVIVLIVVGVCLWLVNTWGAQYIDGKILKIINAVVVVAVILWLLSVFGLFDSLSTVQVPRVR
jgi:hypothetical protein